MEQPIKVNLIKYLFAAILSGILFGVMDGVINANTLAQKLFEVYKPIAKTSVNYTAGIVMDLLYGFIMAGVFIMLYNCLPGKKGILKGISYALITWFFRVLMFVVSKWTMFNIPASCLIYILITGLFEMLVPGIFYGLILHPSKKKESTNSS